MENAGENASQIARMRELAVTLGEASKAYHNDSREIMSDLEYDKLYDELAALEKATGTVLAGSPTMKVGYEVVSKLAKVTHDTPILSLDKTKDAEVLKAFLGDRAGYLSWKMDGLTIVLKYSGGELKQAVSRGNGTAGEDVTHNAKVFKNVPLKIPYTGDLSLRGEAVIDYKSFEKINEFLPEDKKYKNPRNLTSGTVRQLKSEEARSRNVSFFAFCLMAANGVDFSDSKSSQLDWLSKLGFDAVYRETVTQDTILGSIEAFKAKIPTNPFGSDGLVLTFDSLSYSASLGATSKFPKDSLAFKWKDEVAETKLIQVEWSTSRTGLINPVAVFEPVEIEGTTVNKASVHNVSVLESLALGAGDIVQVYKANMIIPQIAKNLTESGTVEIPSKCPACGGDTEVFTSKEGKFLRCVNPECGAKVIMKLVHYASKSAMNIDGLSEQTIEKFVERGFLSEYPDFYALSAHADEISSMEGLGEKSCAKILKSIESSKKCRLPNFIFSLGITQVGLSNAKLLCGYYDNDIEKIIAAKPQELAEIEGFGEVLANSLASYFSDEMNVSNVRKVLPELDIEKVERSSDGPLKGQKIAITGDLSLFANRQALVERIEALGGSQVSSISSKTSFLVNNDSQSPSSKNKKARQLSIPILTEQELVERHPELLQP
jgi:DNA ligase (NAD+)